MNKWLPALRLSLLGAALIASPALALESLSQSITLKNGLNVVVIPNHRVPIVCNMVWYRVGSSDDMPGLSGSAHFLEHMMFKGTKTVKEADFSKIVASYGGNDNAFTSYDYTAYFQLIAKEHLPLIMRLEADRMKNLLMNDSSAEIERQVILEERRTGTDNNPSSLLAEKMRAALYQNTGYGRPVIGPAKEILSIQPNDLDAFYAKYYAPNNATLVIAGDVTMAEVQPLAEKFFGSIKPSTIPVRSDPGAKTALRRDPLTLYDINVRVPEWHRYYVAPSVVSGGPEKAFPLMILAHALGGTETSILYQRLVNEQKVAAYIGVQYNLLSRGNSMFSIYAVPSEGVPLVTLERAINKEIETFLENGIREERLNRIKNYLQAQDIYTRDSIQQMAHAYGQAVTVGTSIDIVESWPQLIGNVTASQVMQAARDLFKNDTAYVTGLLLPQPKEPKNAQ